MIKPPFATVLSLAAMLSVLPATAGTVTDSTTTTQTTSVFGGAAEREIARRQEAAIRAEEALLLADQAMDEKDYEVAATQYRVAVDLLPPSAPTSGLRARALAGMCEASVKLAELRISEGRFADAELLLQTVTGEMYDPECKEALRILANLEDPEYYNRTVTPKFTANVAEVKSLLLQAQGYYDTGRFDMAFRRYEQVLNIDPYNIAARRGQEKVHEARSNYAAGPAYNEARARAIWAVDKAWESPVRRFGPRGGQQFESHQQDIRGTEYITNKLNRIILPRVEFRDASIREAIDFMKQKSRELDPEPDPARKGVNIVLKLESAGNFGVIPTGLPPAADPGIPGLPEAPVAAAPGVVAPLVNPNEARITISLSNIPLMEALRYVTNLAGLKIKVDPYAVSIVPITESTEQLITKEYRVPPGFIGTAAAAAPAQPTAFGATEAGPAVAGRQRAAEFLQQNGVQFPPGASAQFLPASSRLIVRNTQENLDLIDLLVDSASGAVPVQVEIESKFVEITQNNTKELSFDWLLGQFNVGSSERVFAGGGTPGTSPAVDPLDFPFVPPGNTPIGATPLTAGNRSGNIALSANAIDALLFGGQGATSVAPGILGIAGVFTDPQFQVVIRALNQKKGVDLLSAPRVTTKSGSRATIEIIREFIYPTQFDPPQIPQSVGSQITGGLGGFGGGGVSSVPVTPTTPTEFTTRNTGVTLEVEPVVGPDGYTIDLQLVPQVVEFEGFINYGSPILSPGSASFINQLTGALVPGTPQQVITPNVINQPIFSTRKVSTSVSVWDGQTVVLGGLMREDIQKIEDKVPFLGDIPLLGRAFRSSVDQHLKRNLIIFVTARLINPAGEPVNLVEEEEEVVETLSAPETPMILPEAPLFSK